MLRIYTFILEVLRKIAVLEARIRKHDPDLARQLRRAGSSIALNTAEAMGSQLATRRRASALHLAPRKKLARAWMSRRSSATSRSTHNCATTSIGSRQRFIASSREAVQHRADDVQLRSDRFVDRCDVSKRLRNIETGLGLFRRAERDGVERLAIAASRVASFRNVENDACSSSSKLPREIAIAPFDRPDVDREHLEHCKTVVVDSEHDQASFRALSSEGTARPRRAQDVSRFGEADRRLLAAARP